MKHPVFIDSCIIHQYIKASHFFDCGVNQILCILIFRNISPKKPALIEALALNFADNTDAKMETFIEALAEESRQSGEWKGYNKLFESNIRATSHLGEKD